MADRRNSDSAGRTCTFPKTVLKALRTVGQEADRPVSYIIREAVDEYLARRAKKGGKS